MASAVVAQERLECIRLIRIQDPNATHSQIADRLERWRPDLLCGARSQRARAAMVAAVIKRIAEAQDDAIAVGSNEAEQARRTFVRRLEQVFHEAMKQGDWNNARSAAKDIAKACGADVDRPIRIEAVSTMASFDAMPAHKLAEFVAYLSDDDRRAVEAAFPGLLAEDTMDAAYHVDNGDTTPQGGET